jgi:hypothetical protein
MAITALSVTQSGDRSFSASFTSAANTDVVTFASLAAELTEGSAIFAFIDGAPSLADFATEGVSPTLISSVGGSAVVFDATGFKGFEAGDHVLRVSLSYSASA